MSQENVELVRTGYDAFQRGDLTALLEFADPEIVSYTAPPLPEAGEYPGRDGLLQWIADWVEGFDDWTLEVEDYFDAGDQVVVRVLQRGIGSGSGVPVEAHFWLVHTVRGGRLVRIGIHASEAHALEAAGLQE